MTEAQVKKAVWSWTNSAAFKASDLVLFGKGAPKSWTVAIMSDLRKKVHEIKPGVLGWVLRTALPLRDCHRTSDSIYRYLRQDLVVPFSMEGIAFNVECGDLFIGDLEAGRVEV